MRKVIHLIEDDRAISELIAFLLTEEGYDVKVFANPKMYEQRTHSILPHLLVIDVKLSCSDGLAMCQEWKLNPSTRHIPVLVTSAYDGNRIDNRIEKVDYFMSKPFDINEFLDKISSLLS